MKIVPQMFDRKSGPTIFIARNGFDRITHVTAGDVISCYKDGSLVLLRVVDTKNSLLAEVFLSDSDAVTIGARFDISMDVIFGVFKR